MHHRKYLLIILLLLLVTQTITATPTTHLTPQTMGNTLYVGGTGPGNFTYIQAAIDNATDGDTIYVYTGTYQENIHINKTISLIGQNKHTTHIKGNNSGNTIAITMDYIHLTNFTITHSGGGRHEAGIHLAANYTKIYSNIIKNNLYAGILIFFGHTTVASNNHIFNNLITNNMVGIYLNLCHNTLIENNTLIQNSYGITTKMGFLLNGCLNTTINFNHIEKNNIGISLNSGSQTTIHDNNFIRNTRNAIFYFETTADWDHNYWDRARHLPKIILGKAGFFIFRYPYLNFDLHPAPTPFPT